MRESQRLMTFVRGNDGDHLQGGNNSRTEFGQRVVRSYLLFLSLAGEVSWDVAMIAKSVST